MRVPDGKSIAGFAGYLSATDVNWTLAAAVTAAAVLGSLAGAKLAGRVREELLRKAFGWLVVAMGTLVLAPQIPAPLRTNPLFWTAVGAAALAVAAIWLWRSRRVSRMSRSEELPSAYADPVVPAGGTRNPPAVFSGL
jgi:hypothetical protein